MSLLSRINNILPFTSAANSTLLSASPNKVSARTPNNTGPFNTQSGLRNAGRSGFFRHLLSDAERALTKVNNKVQHALDELNGPTKNSPRVSRFASQPTTPLQQPRPTTNPFNLGGQEQKSFARKDIPPYQPGESSGQYRARINAGVRSPQAQTTLASAQESPFSTMGVEAYPHRAAQYQLPDFKPKIDRAAFEKKINAGNESTAPMSTDALGVLIAETMVSQAKLELLGAKVSPQDKQSLANLSLSHSRIEAMDNNAGNESPVPKTISTNALGMLIAENTVNQAKSKVLGVKISQQEKESTANIRLFHGQIEAMENMQKAGDAFHGSTKNKQALLSEYASYGVKVANLAGSDFKLGLDLVAKSQLDVIKHSNHFTGDIEKLLLAPIPLADQDTNKRVIALKDEQVEAWAQRLASPVLPEPTFKQILSLLKKQIATAPDAERPQMSNYIKGRLADNPRIPPARKAEIDQIFAH
ncbi:MAG: hypothetical protein V4754_13470 [Pseudomonadota bacterium]